MLKLSAADLVGIASLLCRVPSFHAGQALVRHHPEGAPLVRAGHVLC